VQVERTQQEQALIANLLTNIKFTVQQVQENVVAAQLLNKIASEMQTLKQGHTDGAQLPAEGKN